MKGIRNSWRFWLSLSLTVGLLAVALVARSASGPVAGKEASQAEQEIAAAMASWVTAIAERRTEELASLVDSQGLAYYLRIKELALTGTPEELASLDETDQLQVMFFRLMVENGPLEQMTAAELLAFAVENGFIGMELRRSDTLGEIKVIGDRASGRLFKFGHQDRPDPYRQYFVKEYGVWRVSLQGERERLVGGFDDFLQRSGLSRSEAAFLILELRVMRKVDPSDFLAPAGSTLTTSQDLVTKSEKMDARDRYRLVAVRLPESLIGRPAAAIDDLATGLKYVLQPGEHLPDQPHLTLHQVAPNQASFLVATGEPDRLVLPLDKNDRLSRRGIPGAGSGTLLDEAYLGANYQGQMMTQWRNLGLRGRPQLLQQAWLTPDFGDGPGADKTMRGLRVRQVQPASFWHQIGLQDGDLLQEFNDLAIDGLEAWQELLRIAESRQELRVRVQRKGNDLVFRTLTVKPG